MERKISETKRKFIANESSKWVDDGIISAETRDGILASYTAVRRLPAVIWALGLTMIGLGVLSFIAANWNALGRIVKIVIIVGLYAASVAASYHFRKKGRETASDLLLFLSGFFLLGGIALMSQVFHISGNVGDLLITWLIVYLPTFLIVRNLSIFILYEIVTLFYVNIAFFNYMENRRYGSETPAVLFVGPYRPLLLTLLLSGVALWMWYERRKISNASSEPWVKNFFVGGSTRRIFFSNFLILNWFTWICVINSRHESLLPYVLGVLAIGALILYMAKRLDAADLEWQGLLIAAAAGLALTFPFVWRFGGMYGSNYDRYIEGAISAPVLASVILGAYLVSRVIRRQRGGGFSTFLFCVLLARWYFDLFYTFMDTAIFFISGGVFMLIVAYVYRKWNKLAGQPRATTDKEGDGDEKTE